MLRLEPNVSLTLKLESETFAHKLNHYFLQILEHYPGVKVKALRSVL